jgi:CDGSH iron-sulfur domain-containing protein 3
MSTSPTGATSVTILPNGPLMVEGAITMHNGEGQILASEEKVFLCRCGHSGRKPFCDGAHRTNGFAAD